MPEPPPPLSPPPWHTLRPLGFGFGDGGSSDGSAGASAGAASAAAGLGAGSSAASLARPNSPLRMAAWRAASVMSGTSPWVSLSRTLPSSSQLRPLKKIGGGLSSSLSADRGRGVQSST